MLCTVRYAVNVVSYPGTQQYSTAPAGFLPSLAQATTVHTEAAFSREFPSVRADPCAPWLWKVASSFLEFFRAGQSAQECVSGGRSAVATAVAVAAAVALAVRTAPCAAARAAAAAAAAAAADAAAAAVGVVFGPVFSAAAVAFQTVAALGHPPVTGGAPAAHSAWPASALDPRCRLRN